MKSIYKHGIDIFFREGVGCGVHPMGSLSVCYDAFLGKLSIDIIVVKKCRASANTALTTACAVVEQTLPLSSIHCWTGKSCLARSSGSAAACWVISVAAIGELHNGDPCQDSCCYATKIVRCLLSLKAKNHSSENETNNQC